MTKIFKRMSALVAGILIGPALILAAPASAQSSDQMRKMLERADANGDGDITRAEFDRVRSDMFARMDRNEDGYVDSKDRPRMFGDRFDQAYRMLSSLDSNRDRRVSQSELVKGEAPAFIAGDANGDNVLSRTEIASLSPPL
ncbi:hypothetical protein [Qipengyuania sp. ASV99]|uniref:hypothetical protein n=1 Tax=Qipengyuania sp. ASV99 TaxID=3399681 RepID=UPI003A4C68F3